MRSCYVKISLQRARDLLLFLLAFSCASSHHISRTVTHEQREQTYSCVTYNRETMIPGFQTLGCSRIEQSKGSFTLHRGDTGSGLYDTPWWCTKWLVKAAMNSRGFCDVKLSDDNVLHASYCGDTQTFLAPTRLKWVVVKSEHNVDRNKFYENNAN